MSAPSLLCNDKMPLYEGAEPFTCSLPAGHIGDHQSPGDGVTASWAMEPQPQHPDDWNLDLGVWVCLDNDHRVISIHRTHVLADKHGWKLWQHISGLPHIMGHVQQSLTPQIRRGMKLDGVSPFVEIVDKKRAGKAFATWDGK